MGFFFFLWYYALSSSKYVNVDLCLCGNSGGPQISRKSSTQHTYKHTHSDLFFQFSDSEVAAQSKGKWYFKVASLAHTPIRWWWGGRTAQWPQFCPPRWFYIWNLQPHSGRHTQFGGLIPFKRLLVWPHFYTFNPFL